MWWCGCRRRASRRQQYDTGWGRGYALVVVQAHKYTMTYTSPSTQPNHAPLVPVSDGPGAEEEERGAFAVQEDGVFLLLLCVRKELMRWCVVEMEEEGLDHKVDASPPCQIRREQPHTHT